MDVILSKRTLAEMRSVLMNKKAKEPVVFYYMLRDKKNKKSFTILKNGMVGREYIKTHGHYHTRKFSEKYKVLAGVGLVLFQERKLVNKKLIDSEISNIKIIKIKAGDTVVIPPNAGHILVNTGKDWLITEDNSPFGSNHSDYALFRKLRGAAYYVVKKNNRPHIVKNTNYKNAPRPKI